MTHLSRLSRRAVLTGAAALAASSAFAAAPMLNAPAPGFYRFKLGAFEVTVLSDGPLDLGPPSDQLFGGLSKDEVAAALTRNYLPGDRIAVEQNAMVVNTGRNLVLFDTGTGLAVKIFGPDAGRLLANLQAAGIDPGAIDTIALTHAHPDHCFGLMAQNGNRNFPNAQIYMTQPDFDFFTDEAKASNDMMKMMIGGARQNLLPNRERIVFIKDGQEIVSGIQAHFTPGHTVGHTSYLISSGNQALLNIGDVCHHAVISTERARAPFAFDTDGQQGVATRLKTFDMLAVTRTPMVAYHFPWPGIGFIAKDNGNYRYVPMALRTLL